MGACPITATRMSVIFRSEGFEYVFVFCGSASRISSAQNVPAARSPAPLRKFRRANLLGLTGFILLTASARELITTEELGGQSCFSDRDAASYTLRTGASTPDRADSDRYHWTYIYPSLTSSASIHRGHGFPRHCR